MLHWYDHDMNDQLCNKDPCIMSNDLNNGLYNCALREDEFKETSDQRHSRISTDSKPVLGSLEFCTRNYGHNEVPGLHCGGTCIYMHMLCDPKQSVSLVKECQVGDLCSNQTFFRQFKEFEEKETEYTGYGGTGPGEMVFKCRLFNKSSIY